MIAGGRYRIPSGTKVKVRRVNSKEWADYVTTKPSVGTHESGPAEAMVLRVEDFQVLARRQTLVPLIRSQISEHG